MSSQQDDMDRRGHAPEIDALAKAVLHLSIEHNPHKVYYEPIAEYLAQLEIEAPGATEDSLWVVRAYPDTPVGFVIFAAGSLFDALAALQGRVIPPALLATEEDR